ncbi:microsomal glutathione S-transferase 1-like [Daktulosphaira vitifoliae]|uniref:Microsomal glutathione S-transferase 1 n=1 Tax=Daktulosphaira vitifoliae TaxID=58002 RepID=A0A2I6QGS2_DAKVI|nr:microsomal glutathione S-transferase 1-like [Daktulosphaira vitifoliae]AUN35389.1 glutathione S-transferase m [Daktulosphaira vitifoliae]
MAQLSSSFTMENPVFECYAFYSSILILKMILMSFLTIIQRMKKKVFISPEDLTLNPIKASTGEVLYDDPDIERVRRAHLNDLENIPIFLITGLLFVASRPAEMLAMNLFRLYTLVRIIHTSVYAIYVVPQPTRAIMFIIGVIINIIMIICILIKMHQF